MNSSRRSDKLVAFKKDKKNLVLTVEYFEQLITQNKSRVENKNDNIHEEFDQFLIHLDGLKKEAKIAFESAQAENDLATLNYLSVFSKKLTNLKEIIATSKQPEKIEKAVDAVMVAAQPPSGIRVVGQRIVNVVAGIAGAICGMVVGAVTGSIAAGVTAASTVGIIGVPLAVFFPLIYITVLTGLAAVGAIAGAIGGLFNGKEYAQDYIGKKMPLPNIYHINKIQQATQTLFGYKEDQNRKYNGHLFFCNKPDPAIKKINSVSCEHELSGSRVLSFSKS